MENKHPHIDPENERGVAKSWQPFQVLLFNVAVFGLLLGIMAVFPKDGLQINGEVTLYFPTLSGFLAADTTEANMDEILAEIEELSRLDTLKAQNRRDSLAQAERRLAQIKKKIQFPDGDRTILHNAFRELEQAASGSSPVRVMHFGDSQIEGDRMTSFIRARMQEKFGGSGPGLVSANPPVPSFSLVQDQSENMKRYPGYGAKNPGIHHKRYGALAAFSRFTPPVADSMLDSLSVETGWLKLQKSKVAYNKSKIYNRLRMFYGYNRRGVQVKLFADDVPLTEDSIPANNGLRVKEWSFAQTPTKLMMFLEGVDSPELYGFSLESSSGVVVDNIGMRGQSGTLFSRLDRGILKGMIEALDVKLLLLQFGGNTVPYIKDSTAAVNYGNSFKHQINYLKGLVPGVSVIVLGPSDMATKVGGKLQTYPNLEKVRDALQAAAFGAGAAYFDIYEVMGGRNSMKGWVENKPPLAAKDYVHFSPSGAKKIAKAFWASFMEEYEAYRAGRKGPSVQTDQQAKPTVKQDKSPVKSGKKPRKKGIKEVKG